MERVDEKGSELVQYIYEKIFNLLSDDERIRNASAGYFYAALLCVTLQLEDILGPNDTQKIKEAVFLVRKDQIKSPARELAQELIKKVGEC